MNNFKKFAAAIIIPAILSGCATIVSGTTQQIQFQAIDEKTNETLDNVTCSVVDGRGVQYRVAGNPGHFTATKGNGALTPTCRKDGYKQTSVGVGDSFNAVTLVNVIFWPGFIVDAMSGAMKDYPSHMTVYMQKQ